MKKIGLLLIGLTMFQSLFAIENSGEFGVYVPFGIGFGGGDYKGTASTTVPTFGDISESTTGDFDAPFINSSYGVSYMHTIENFAVGIYAGNNISALSILKNLKLDYEIDETVTIFSTTHHINESINIPLKNYVDSADAKKYRCFNRI